jgi:hypothetical protein
MITLTAEIICDTCGRVVATGEPSASVGAQTQAEWAWTILVAEAKARSHGAQINVATVTCADCLAKERDSQVAAWEQSVKDNPPKRVF